MYALFVSLSTDIGLNNLHVYLFDSEAAAITFAVDALVEAGDLNREPGGRISSVDREDFFWTTEEEALDAWQETLGGSEYFHVYDTTVCQEPTGAA